jgi:hypothetical protein
MKTLTLLVLLCFGAISEQTWAREGSILRTAVVRVFGHLTNAPDEQHSASQGTGWFFNNHELITNYHVVKGCNEFVIQYRDNRFVKATLYRFNEACDLAVLHVASTRSDQTWFWLLPDADSMQPYASVSVISYPRNSFAATEGTLTSRTVSANGHVVIWESNNLLVDHGSSGAPVLNADGYVIGVVESRSFEGQPYSCRIITANVIWEALHLSDREHPNGIITDVTDGLDITAGIRGYGESSPTPPPGLTEVQKNDGGPREFYMGSKEDRERTLASIKANDGPGTINFHALPTDHGPGAEYHEVQPQHKLP